jgi:hypothetical protein
MAMEADRGIQEGTVKSAKEKRGLHPNIYERDLLSSLEV